MGGAGQGNMRMVWKGKVPGASEVQSAQEGPLPSSQGSETT